MLGCRQCTAKTLPDTTHDTTRIDGQTPNDIQNASHQGVFFTGSAFQYLGNLIKSIQANYGIFRLFSRLSQSCLGDIVVLLLLRDWACVT
jgi:hypothetical protein